MVQNSWEDGGRSVDQGILRLLLNPEIYYRVHKSTGLAPFLSQLIPIHTLVH